MGTDFDPQDTFHCVVCGTEKHRTQIVNEGKLMEKKDTLKKYEGMCNPCVYALKELEEKSIQTKIRKLLKKADENNFWAKVGIVFFILYLIWFFFLDPNPAPLGDNPSIW